MKICKNKGKTTIVASRQGNMWHLWNGGDGEANANKAGMTKGGKQLSMSRRTKPTPETPFFYSAANKLTLDRTYKW